MPYVFLETLYFWKLMSAWEFKWPVLRGVWYPFCTPAAAVLMMGFGKAGLDGHKAFSFWSVIVQPRFLECDCANQHCMW